MPNKKIVHGSRKQEKAQINWTMDYWNSECCDDNMVPMIGNRRNLHQSSYRRIKGFVTWKILRAARKNNGANLEEVPAVWNLRRSTAERVNQRT